MMLTNSSAWYKPYFIQFKDSWRELANIKLYDENGVQATVGHGWFDGYDWQKGVALPIDNPVRRLKEKFDGKAFFIKHQDRYRSSSQYPKVDLYLPLSLFKVEQIEDESIDYPEYKLIYEQYKYSVGELEFVLRQNHRKEPIAKNVIWLNALKRLSKAIGLDNPYNYRFIEKERMILEEIHAIAENFPIKEIQHYEIRVFESKEHYEGHEIYTTQEYDTELEAVEAAQKWIDDLWKEKSVRGVVKVLICRTEDDLDEVEIING